MDLFEEIVKMRRAGQRGALATIVHTNGSIPSYESSRMLVREDGSIEGTIGGGCVEAEVWAAAKEVMQKEAPRKMVFHLNNEANYDNGLICGVRWKFLSSPSCRSRWRICSAAGMFRWRWREPRTRRGLLLPWWTTAKRLRTKSDSRWRRNFSQATSKPSRRSGRTPQATW